MKRVYLILLPLIAFACQGSPIPEEIPPYNGETEDLAYQQVADEQARAVIKKAIEYAGGLEKFWSANQVSYSKDWQLLDASGAIERDVQQLHHIEFTATSFNIRVESKEGEETTITTRNKGQFERTVNGKTVEADKTTLASYLNSSTYPTFMPFALLDEGTTLTYKGIDTLASGQVVDVLQASYEQAENTTSNDIWKYFFDRETGAMPGCWVKTPDHYSYIENLSMQRVDSLLFYKNRESYRVDSLGNKLFLRATYEYNNFKVE